MKPTIWNRLQAEQCTVLEVDERFGKIMSVKLSHPSLGRALWFPISQKGNFYWRNTGGAGEHYAEGYIVVGGLDGLVGAPRAYPELALHE